VPGSIGLRLYVRPRFARVGMIMDIEADTEAPNIERTAVAWTLVEQLCASEQVDVRSSVDRVARRFDPSRVVEARQSWQGQQPICVYGRRRR